MRQHWLADLPDALGHWFAIDATPLPMKHPSGVRGVDRWIGPDELHAGFGRCAAKATWFDRIRLALDDLPDVARDWSAMADGERASWSLDWDHLMGTYLRLLIQYDHAGSLTTSQHQRYCALLARLKEAAPLIEDLQLYPPPSAGR